MAKNPQLSFSKIVEVVAETTAPLTPMEKLLEKIPSKRPYVPPPKVILLSSPLVFYLDHRSLLKWWISLFLFISIEDRNQLQPKRSNQSLLSLSPKSQKLPRRMKHLQKKKMWNLGRCLLMPRKTTCSSTGKNHRNDLLTWHWLFSICLVPFCFVNII